MSETNETKFTEHFNHKHIDPDARMEDYTPNLPTDVGGATGSPADFFRYAFDDSFARVTNSMNDPKFLAQLKDNTVAPNHYGESPEHPLRLELELTIIKPDQIFRFPDLPEPSITAEGELRQAMNEKLEKMIAEFERTGRLGLPGGAIFLATALFQPAEYKFCFLLTVGAVPKFLPKETYGAISNLVNALKAENKK